MHKRLSRAFIHLVWYALVTSLVLCGLLISLIWITHSSMDQLSPRILAWVEERTGMPVEVDNVNIDWYGVFPELNLDSIKLINPDTQQAFTKIDNARLRLDLPGSIKNWQAKISHLRLKGLDLSVIHTADDTFQIEGWPTPSDNQGSAMDWLMRQHDLSLEQANITLHEAKWQLDPIRFENLQATWLLQPASLHGATQTTRLITAKTELNQNSGQIEVALKLIGDPRQPDWNLQVVSASQSLKLLRLIPESSQQKLNKTISQAGLNFQHPILNGTTDIKLRYENNIGTLETASGNIRLTDQNGTDTLVSGFELSPVGNKNWELHLPRLSVQHDQHSVSLNQLNIRFPEQSDWDSPQFDASIGKLDLASIQRFLSSIDDKKITLPSLLRTETLLGELNQLRLVKGENDQIHFEGQFKQLGIAVNSQHPGLTGLKGSIRSDLQNWQLDLDSQNIRITPTSYSEPSLSPVREAIVVEQLKGQLELNNQADSRQLTIKQLQLTDPRLQLQLNGVVQDKLEQGIESQLDGSIFGGDVAGFVSLIPADLLPKRTERWLNDSLKGGQIQSGTIQLHGNLDNFPFDQKDGIFDIRLNVENGILQFDPEWPEINNILADVRFVGRRMIIQSPSAKIFESNVDNVTVEMPDLLNDGRHLLINGHTSGSVKDAIKYVVNSPLNENMGKRLSSLDLSGPMELNLKLDVPLHEDAVTQVDGLIQLKNTKLDMQQPPINLTQLTGELAFDRDTWQSKTLKASLFDSPVTIELDRQTEGPDENSTETIEVKLSGTADRNYLINRLTELGLQKSELKFLDQLSGSTSWRAILKLGDENNKEQRLIIHSDLIGMEINAPTPVGKTSDEKRNLMINTSLEKNSTSSSTFRFDQLVAGRWLTSSDQDSPHLKHLSLRFGKKAGQQVSPIPKLVESVTIAVSGHLLEADISEWQQFLSDQELLPSTENNQSNITLETDLSVSLLHAGSYTFKNNQINLQKRTDLWQLNVQNHALDGSIQREANGTIKAQFDRLHLEGNKESSKPHKLDLASVPPLDIQAKDFSINGIELGQLTLMSQPQGNGLKVDKLHLKNQNLEVNANGLWHFINTQQQSHFNIEAKGETLEGLLGTFGYNVDGVHANQAHITSEAKWPGTPADFSLDRVQGSLSLDIGDGRLTEVDNRVGKLFGLLSIQTIGRRLSLDFNDLFEKGFSFDSITGSFDVSRGDAYTNDLSVIGPPAQIYIGGRVGLATQDYDQVVTVIPSISDSLPVASALFGPIGAGVGAAIFLTDKILPVLPDTLDKMLMRQYEVKGDWENPTVTPVSIQEEDNKELSPAERAFGTE